MLQSAAPNGAHSELLRRYGHVIVDECHHVPADSFEAVLKAVSARYVLGLTATPVRRDNQQPVMFMQCGPVRHVSRPPANAPQRLEVLPQRLTAEVGASTVGYWHRGPRQRAGSRISSNGLFCELIWME